MSLAGALLLTSGVFLIMSILLLSLATNDIGRRFLEYSTRRLFAKISFFGFAFSLILSLVATWTGYFASN